MVVVVVVVVVGGCEGRGGCGTAAVERLTGCRRVHERQIPGMMGVCWANLTGVVRGV